MITSFGLTATEWGIIYSFNPMGLLDPLKIQEIAKTLILMHKTIYSTTKCQNQTWIFRPHWFLWLVSKYVSIHRKILEEIKFESEYWSSRFRERGAIRGKETSVWRERQRGRERESDGLKSWLFCCVIGQLGWLPAGCRLRCGLPADSRWSLAAAAAAATAAVQVHWLFVCG